VAVTAAEAEVGPETIDACRRGDRAAFRTVYNAYKDRVFSIALYTLHGNADLAADVTQQVFIKLMDRIASFRGDSEFSTWLYRLVTNACLDAQRRSKSRSLAVDSNVLDTLPDPASLEKAFARTQTAELVKRAVSALPSKLRLAMLLREGPASEDDGYTVHGNFPSVPLSSAGRRETGSFLFRHRCRLPLTSARYGTPASKPSKKIVSAGCVVSTAPMSQCAPCGRAMPR